MEAAALRDEERFALLLRLQHDELVPFVQDEFGRRTGVIRFYLGLNLAWFAFMTGLGWWQITMGMIDWKAILQFVGCGFLISLTLLIPLHEGIHGLAYKLAGAPRIAFGGSLREFYFYAVADRFVLNSFQFKVVALAPFVVINGLALLATLYVSLNYQWLLWGVILMHTGAGDFGLLSFYARQEKGEIYTYDIVAEKVTYFFIEKSPATD